ncbi:MAG: class I SAM-dependent methyltransferase [Candidatus Eisenbacteria bacterium]|nr:class I SAM-dependent methyltransferase [Candidatus Eisenbacteria bacterium]
MGGGYYEQRLSAERLRRCYAVAPPPARAYLKAEIEHILSRLGAADAVLELGCGYGRILAFLAPRVRVLWGIDRSVASLALAREAAAPFVNIRLAAMDAARLAFRYRSFDAVICAQNGISAFGVDPVRLIGEALQAARPGGKILVSSYADRFWEDRLDWFEAQAREGLLGPIDRRRTGDGVIVCEDGFRAGIARPADFERWTAELGVTGRITEVAGSSLFCEIVAPDEGRGGEANG